VIDECKQRGIPAPTFEERCGYTVVTSRAAIADAGPQVTPQIEQVVHACQHKAISRDELQRTLDLADREHFRTAYMLPALASGLVERTIPDKPKSRLQQYRLSAAGRAWLAAKKT
jgi:hypothetical protein